MKFIFKNRKGIKKRPERGGIPSGRFQAAWRPAAPYLDFSNGQKRQILAGA